MSKINELIKEICPNGVNYRKIDDVTTIKRGERITKRDLEEHGLYKVISGGTEPMGYYNEYNRGENTITISSYGYAGYVNFIEEKFWANDVCLCIFPKEIINNKYLYYVLKNLQSYFFSKTTKAIPDHIPTEIIKETIIPVPPLEVQDEIVRILDDFTLLSAELSTELSTELKAREKQYNFYVDKLFDFDNKMKVPLLEICNMERGGNFQKKHFTEEGIPAIHYGKIYTYYGLYTNKTLNFIDEDIAKKQKFANCNDIVMAVTSENVEDVCKCVVWEGEEPVAVSGHSIIIKHNQNARFLAYYFTSTHFQRQKEKYCIGTKVIEMKPDNLAKILVPIPSIEEQNKIVKILDKFYSITNDISERLSAEKESRRKQYEYYRDKLLTFEEKKDE